LDIAMWDAAGKTLGQPLFRLLGGYRDRVSAYASDGFWYSLTLEELAASARASVAQGFGALKLRLGHEANSEDEAQRLAAVRESVPPRVQILVDATESWDPARAIRTGMLLQKAGIQWLEDPIDHQDLTGLARIADHLDVPIATGEHLYQVSEFARLLQAGAARIAILDLGRLGGITPWRRVAALAHAFNVPVCGHVLPEVHLHLLASIPNGHMVEYVPRSAAILQAMPALEDGCLVAPKSPGLGLALDENAVRRYRVSD
jgi:L-alanine-DL-glutamate epimerase-like enolase superfamily enzyme